MTALARAATALTLPIVCLCLLSPAAHASDKGLQRTVINAENKHLIPASVAFGKADQAYAKDPNATPDDLLAKTGEFRHSIGYTEDVVVPLKATTAEYAAGKKQFLTALREYDIGLAQYLKAVKSASSGASRATVVKSLKKFVKRIRAAAEDESSALKALHIVEA